MYTKADKLKDLGFVFDVTPDSYLVFFEGRCIGGASFNTPARIENGHQHRGNKITPKQRHVNNYREAVKIASRYAENNNLL